MPAPRVSAAACLIISIGRERWPRANAAGPPAPHYLSDKDAAVAEKIDTSKVQPLLREKRAALKHAARICEGFSNIQATGLCGFLGHFIPFASETVNR